jgi:hypothetical protein
MPTTEQPNDLCTRCRKSRPAPGHVRCAACVEYGRAHPKHRYYYRWKAAGLCCQCGSRVTTAGVHRCERCRAIGWRYSQARYIECIESGICTSCRKWPAAKGGRLCLGCREASKRRYYAAQERRRQAAA